MSGGSVAFHRIAFRAADYRNGGNFFSHIFAVALGTNYQRQISPYGTEHFKILFTIGAIKFVYGHLVLLK